MAQQSTPGGEHRDDPRREQSGEVPQQGRQEGETPAGGFPQEPGDPLEEAGRAAPPPSDDPLEILRLEAEGLREELASLKDQLLRALAETENVRNRARREREEAARYAAAPLAKDLLPVADNLRRAIESVPVEAAAADARLQGLLTGVEMTEKTLLDALAKHGVGRIEALGERLDPHRHEAMMEVQDPSKPSGTVAQVFDVGYVLHDRLLRPARVAVAKGGAAPNPGTRVDTEV